MIIHRCDRCGADSRFRTCLWALKADSGLAYELCGTCWGMFLEFMKNWSSSTSTTNINLGGK